MRENLEKYSFQKLRIFCKEKGLSSSGKKMDLIERLQEYFNNLQNSGEEIIQKDENSRKSNSLTNSKNCNFYL